MFFRRFAKVSLYDWWLIKAQNDFQGKRLAVSGISSRNYEALRVFVSGPIVERHDLFSLKTADGVYVLINGLINEQHTLENGFRREVCSVCCLLLSSALLWMRQVFNKFLFGFPPDWESYALDCFREESTPDSDLGRSAVPHDLSANGPGPENLSDGVEKSIPNPLVSPKEATKDQGKLFPEDEWNVLEGTGGNNVAYGSGRKRCSARLQNVKVCQQKKQLARGRPPKHPDKEQHSTSAALENCCREESTPCSDFGSVPHDISASVESSIPNPLVSPEEATQDHEKLFPEDKGNVSEEVGGNNVAYGSGGNRRSTRLQNVKVCQQKKQLASGRSPKHPDKEQRSTSAALENCNEEGLKSPETPIQSQSQKQINTSSGNLVNKYTSRISRTLSPKSEGCYKKKRVTSETKVVRPKKKLTESASSVKSLQEKDVSPLVRGSKQKISSISPQSLSFRTSRSGRLLLPPLEFWRNQVPVYNADHEVTEIQEGASLVSPCRGLAIRGVQDDTGQGVKGLMRGIDISCE
ncbi:hypothetical protein RJT34_24221 [Clitoria ternatea]|uniref:SANTA domain-containing protein n=1 Tax=Clitoria ternatea TaxID=43366 RepID=A0AAN9IJ23_CLITE